MKRKVKQWKMTHTALKKAVVDLLQYHRWFVVPIRQSLGSKRGIFDLCNHRNGRTLWVEIKVGKDELSKDQRLFADDLDRAEIPWCVIKTVDEAENMVKFEDDILSANNSYRDHERWHKKELEKLKGAAG